MAHTGGTWKRGKAFASIVTDKYEGVEGAYSPETLEAYGGYVIAESISERNMPVLLAAPDLLAACERILKLIDCRQIYDKDARTVLEQAIAKAKGE